MIMLALQLLVSAWCTVCVCVLWECELFSLLDGSVRPVFHCSAADQLRLAAMAFDREFCPTVDERLFCCATFL